MQGSVLSIFFACLEIMHVIHFNAVSWYKQQVREWFQELFKHDDLSMLSRNSRMNLCHSLAICEASNQLIWVLKFCWLWQKQVKLSCLASSSSFLRFRYICCTCSWWLHAWSHEEKNHTRNSIKNIWRLCSLSRNYSKNIAENH